LLSGLGRLGGGSCLGLGLALRSGLFRGLFLLVLEFLIIVVVLIVFVVVLIIVCSASVLESVLLGDLERLVEFLAGGASLLILLVVLSAVHEHGVVLLVLLLRLEEAAQVELCACGSGHREGKLLGDIYIEIESYTLRFILLEGGDGQLLELAAGLAHGGEKVDFAAAGGGVTGERYITDMQHWVVIILQRGLGLVRLVVFQDATPEHIKIVGYYLIIKYPLTS
jgi:hypothetical protein